jgi:hypothetical protein
MNKFKKITAVILSSTILTGSIAFAGISQNQQKMNNSKFNELLGNIKATLKPKQASNDDSLVDRDPDFEANVQGPFMDETSFPAFGKLTTLYNNAVYGIYQHDNIVSFIHVNGADLKIPDIACQYSKNLIYTENNTLVLAACQNSSDHIYILQNESGNWEDFTSNLPENIHINNLIAANKKVYIQSDKGTFSCDLNNRDNNWLKQDFSPENRLFNWRGDLYAYKDYGKQQNGRYVDANILKIMFITDKLTPVDSGKQYQFRDINKSFHFVDLVDQKANLFFDINTINGKFHHVFDDDPAKFEVWTLNIDTGERWSAGGMQTVCDYLGSAERGSNGFTWNLISVCGVPYVTCGYYYGSDNAEAGEMKTLYHGVWTAFKDGAWKVVSGTNRMYTSITATTDSRIFTQSILEDGEGYYTGEFHN